MALAVYSRDIQQQIIASLDEGMSPPTFRIPCNVTLYVDDGELAPHEDSSLKVDVHPTLPPGNLASLYAMQMESMVTSSVYYSMWRFVDRMLGPIDGEL